MSTVSFGALTTRREKSDSGKSKSEQPPGLNSYIDILAALVPAEVLAIHVVVMATVTTTNAHGQTQIADSTTLRWAFWLLIGLSIALFVLGRRPVRQRSSEAASGWQRWEGQDWIRLLIPPLAFVGWAMLEPTSVWNAVAPRMSGGMRILIPTVGAVLLAAITKALTTHADKKSSAEELKRAQEAQQHTAEKAAVAGQEAAHPHSLTSDGAGARDKRSGKKS